MNKVIRFRQKPTDQERFDVLVRPHFDALYLTARRLSGSELDAEDLLQEVMLKSITWLDELEQIEYPRAWLMKVTFNTFIDQARKEQRSPMSMVMERDTEQDIDQLPSNDDPPAKLIDQERQIEQVIRAMRHLGSEQCALIGMRDIEGFSIKELCAITGMPAGTVKSQLHRARKKLGRLLSNDAVSRPHLTVAGGKQ